ncbi:MAG TPA: orotidine-5'-phosphate decarboxylase [Actinomycetales bacterium]|nr:orotidine-5'-phosphate decarboxylase [Actinomycetales bacterium]
MTTADGVVPFGQRLRAAMAERGPLCVGIDPHPSLLAGWGLPDDAHGLERFALTCVEALAGRVAVLKPQSAFFERHGSAGVAVLERVLAEAPSSGCLTLLDAKRGDIGSTMDAYAQAYLGSGPLTADAVTLSPFLGYGSLRPAIDLALASGRGVFVLALTSNPEGASVQHARGSDGRSVAASVIEGAAADNTGAADAADDLGSVGLVVGATVGSAVTDLGLDLAASRAPLLAPGIGAQGAGPDELKQVFGEARRNVLASSSRAVLAAGPSVAALREAAGRTVDQLAAALR